MSFRGRLVAGTGRWVPSCECRTSVGFSFTPQLQHISSSAGMAPAARGGMAPAAEATALSTHQQHRRGSQALRLQPVLLESQAPEAAPVEPADAMLTELSFSARCSAQMQRRRLQPCLGYQPAPQVSPVRAPAAKDVRVELELLKSRRASGGIVRSLAACMQAGGGDTQGDARMGQAVRARMQAMHVRGAWGACLRGAHEWQCTASSLSVLAIKRACRHRQRMRHSRHARVLSVCRLAWAGQYVGLLGLVSGVRMLACGGKDETRQASDRPRSPNRGWMAF
jgi:hypothetical protein